LRIRPSVPPGLRRREGTLAMPMAQSEVLQGTVDRVNWAD